MELAIKHCGGCRTSFTLSDFRELPKMADGKSDNGRATETRQCHCDRPLTVSTEYWESRLEAGALFVPPSQYDRDFPRSVHAPADSAIGVVTLSNAEAKAIGFRMRRQIRKQDAGAIAIMLAAVAVALGRALGAW